MTCSLSQKNKFFILASLIFFGVSVAFSVISGLFFSQMTFMKIGPLSGIGGWIYGLVGVTGVVVGLFVGALVALVINIKLGKKWGVPERVKLTCLSFLAFLVLLWGLIVAIARL